MIGKEVKGMSHKDTFLNENRDQLTLFGVIVAAIFVILVGILAWDVPVLGACILILLEAALAVCMHNVPIWLHGVVVIAEVVTGAIFGRALFLLLCGAFYVVSILALNIWNR